MIKGLPEKLQTLRTRFGYSQKQVADILGSSASIISGYETGERTPSTEMLLALSDLYKCSTDYLLGKESDTQRVLNCDGLTDTQIHALRMLIASIKQ